MKAPFTLGSAIEKVAIVVAFLPMVTMVYPETVAAAYTAQNRSEEQALVFEIDSKQTSNQNTTIQTNPTLSNPCYPGPIGSCNPDSSAAEQSIVIAQTAALKKAELGDPSKQYSPAEVQELIVHYSAIYKINPATPLCIAKYESGFNQHSKNKRSTASGVFQYLNGTWRATDEGKAGRSVFDADANVKAAVKYMGVHKNTRPWEVRAKCPAVSFVK